MQLLDLIRVVLHRLRKHRNPFLSDRNYIHHKLLRTGMRNLWMLVTVLCIVMMYVGLNTLLLKFMDVTLILAVGILVWIGQHLIINESLKVRAKDHPEDARVYVESSKR